MQDAAREFDGDPATVPLARRFVQDVLAQWQLADSEWLALQLLSELVTNAVIHARTSYVVTVVHDAATTRLTVRDRSLRPVVPRHYRDEATTGRGLRLVAQMSRDWGVEAHSDGKTVWVEFDQALPEQVDMDVDALLNAFDDDMDDVRGVEFSDCDNGQPTSLAPWVHVAGAIGRRGDRAA